MHLPSKPKVVVLGMMTKMPVAGVVWQNVHYLVGFVRLGCEVYYVEEHARTPSMFLATEQCDGSSKAAAFIDSVMRRFDLGGRWALHALHEETPRCFGMSHTQLRELYASADIIINLHGGTIPLPEHYATGRLVYLETDPVQLQIELHDNRQETVDFLEPHVAFFTFGENLGAPDCGLPVSEIFPFRPTRQPVVMDFWNPPPCDPGEHWTSIGNWEQRWREVHFKGETYSWSKHHEFLKIIDLPSRTSERFELALASYTPDVKAMLETHGWTVRDALDFSMDADAYRSFVAGSRGEFTVAKDQNVRLRSGWFSDRSATYLAAGRPVITQETGFSNILPTGCGLFAFSTADDALAALDATAADHSRHCRAAEEIAREFFSHEVVLKRLLDEIAIANRVPRPSRARRATLPPSLVLAPLSRRPLRLAEATLGTALALPVPLAELPPPRPDWWTATVVMVTFNNLAVTKLSLTALLANTRYPNCEIIVVDNASSDGTANFLRELAAENGCIRVIQNEHNAGFAAACNQGLAAAQHDILLLLNNDTIVPPYWLGLLLRHFEDTSIGLLGPVTNRIGNEQEISVSYRTYAEFLTVAGERYETHAGRHCEIEMAAMFCMAMRREVWEQIGALDEGFGVGLFEDDDYSMRARAAGFRVVCAEDVIVHHFGEASFGALSPTGDYGPLFAANQRRFEEKWGVSWKPHRRREEPIYREMVQRVQEMIAELVPPAANLMVVSKGDEELVKIAGCDACHFPQSTNGGYAGRHPVDSHEAIRLLEAARDRGVEFLVLPATALWWLEHYDDFASHLASHYRLLEKRASTGAIYSLRQEGG